MSKAAIAARLTMSVAVADMDAICTGFASPVSSGPYNRDAAKLLEHLG